ncbi:MAG: DUF481 domain-containing protein [Pseudomonadota bacterium]
MAFVPMESLTWHSASAIVASAVLAAVPLSAAGAQDLTLSPDAGLPDIASAMLEAAEETGDPAQVEAVANAVKQVFPDFAGQIDASAGDMIAALTPPEPEAPEPPPAEEDPLKAEANKYADAGWFSPGPWVGKITAGAANATGNSENTAIGIAFDGARLTGKFTHNVSGYFDLGRSRINADDAGKTTTQKRWGAAYQLDYAISDRTYAFGRVSFDEDEFSAFEYRLFGGGGIGHFLYKSEPFTWKIEAGPGFQYSPVENSLDVQEELAIYGASETDWLIRDGLLFEQDFLATWTDPTTTFVSTSSLTTTLTDAISTGISYQVRYETNPPPGQEDTDTILRANLTYGF